MKITKCIDRSQVSSLVLINKYRFLRGEGVSTVSFLAMTTRLSTAEDSDLRLKLF